MKFRRCGSFWGSRCPYYVFVWKKCLNNLQGTKGKCLKEVWNFFEKTIENSCSLIVWFWILNFLQWVTERSKIFRNSHNSKGVIYSKKDKARVDTRRNSWTDVIKKAILQQRKPLCTGNRSQDYFLGFRETFGIQNQTI